MKYTSMHNEIQNDEILKQSFGKNIDELNDIEQKRVEKFLKRKLAEMEKFLAERSDRDGK